MSYTGHTHCWFITLIESECVLWLHKQIFSKLFSFDLVHLTHTLRPVLGVRVWTRGEVVGEEGEGVMVNRGEEQEMVKERLEDVRLTSVT